MRQRRFPPGDGALDLRLAPIALGCWASALATLHAGWRVGLVVAGGAVAIGVAIALLAKQWRWIVASAAVGLALGALSTAARQSTMDTPELRSLVENRAGAVVEAAIGDDPRPARGGTWVISARLLAVEPGLRMDVRVVILARGEGWRDLLPGQRVRATVRFGTPRGGDLAAAALSTSSPPEAHLSPPWVQRAAASLRAGLQRACDPLEDRPGGLLPGLVVGDTSRLLAELEQQFREVGLTHLTAVSGSNVAIVVGLAVFATRWCRAGPRVTAALAAVAIVGFVILARPSPSVLRAAAMGGVGLLALASGRHRAALPALTATIVVLVVVDPELAGDPGFALSVLATGGLLLLAPPMRDRLRRRGVPAGAAEALAIPASAQLACAPVVAALSGAVSLVAIPANLLAVPAVAPATLTGVAAAALSPVWPQGAEFAAWLGGWPAWWLVKVAEVGSGVPAGNLPWPSGVWGGLALAVLLAGVLIGVRWRAVRIWVSVGAVAILVGAVPVRLVTPGWPPPGWIVVLCDVGQGDAIVLRAGQGAAVVVDAGPEADPMRRCLDDLGISRVPVVVFSHFHLDHIGGLDGVLRHRPGRLILPAFADPAAGRRAVLAGAARVAAAVSEVSEGEWTAGEVTLRVLPTGRLGGTRSDPNNNSLIVVATVAGIRVLLLGDAEAEQQAVLRAQGLTGAVEVLKVAHHGSHYQDPELLDLLRPRVALVSVGTGNGYGHPSPHVLDRLRANGSVVCRTDRDGDVAVVAAGPGRLEVARREAGP